MVAYGQFGSDGSCLSPTIEIGMAGDVKSVSVGMEEDTCAIVVIDIILKSGVNEPIAPIAGKGSILDHRSTAQSSSDYEWKVRSKGEWRGAGNEELTQANAFVTFWTANLHGGGAVFGGSQPSYYCYANHSAPVFW